MSILILGINHKTAPITLREKISFSPDIIQNALYSLHQHPLINGCVILSTCNRTEIYVTYDHSIDKLRIERSMEEWLSYFHKIQLKEYKDSLYWYENKLAVKHLMKVACGIDSMILGEPQILGQVKKAYHYSKENNCLSTELQKLFHRIFYVAKKVRTETNIGTNTASIAYSACLVARKIFPNTKHLNLLLIGAGETIELIARYLDPHNFNKIIVANRTREKALKLANLMEAEIIALPDIAVRLSEIDIVISSTSSPLPIIGKGMVERSMIVRKNNLNNDKMLLIDLAVPRDIEDEIRDIENIKLFSVDDLQKIIQSNLEQRSMAAKEAEHIIDEESEQFIQLLDSEHSIKLVKEYRSKAKSIQLKFKNKALNEIKNGKNIDDVITKLTFQLTNRLIHAPTKALVYAAKETDQNYLNTLCRHLELNNID